MRNYPFELKMSTTDKVGSLCFSIELCVVCGDRASGRHYGAVSCEGCKGFFKRSIRKQLWFQCWRSKRCEVTKHNRNRCQYCRFQKCLEKGMIIDLIQHERKPINEKGNRDVSSLTSANNNSTASSDLGSKIFLKKDLETPPSASSVTNFTDVNLLSGCHLKKSACNGIKDSAQNSDEDSIESHMADMRDPDLVAREKALKDAWSLINKVVCEEDNDNENGGTDADDDGAEGPLVEEIHTHFSIQLPTHDPVAYQDNFVCEVGCRILFSTVHWARNLPAFQDLDCELQVTLMRLCWPELFVLGLAQCSEYIPIKPLLNPSLCQLRNSVLNDPSMDPQRPIEGAENILRLYDVVSRLAEFQCDNVEYAYLKVLVMFTWHLPGLSLPVRRHIDRLQEKAVQELENYERRLHIHDRTSNLVLRLMPLCQLKPQALGDTFFSGCIGSVQVETIIPHILEMGPESFNEFYSQGHMNAGIIKQE